MPSKFEEKVDFFFFFIRYSCLKMAKQKKTEKEKKREREVESANTSLFIGCRDTEEEEKKKMVAVDADTHTHPPIDSCTLCSHDESTNGVTDLLSGTCQRHVKDLSIWALSGTPTKIKKIKGGFISTPPNVSNPKIFYIFFSNQSRQDSQAVYPQGSLIL